MKIEIECDEKALRKVAGDFSIGNSLGQVAEAIKKALPEETVTIEVPRSAAEAVAQGKVLGPFMRGEWTGSKHYDALRAACQTALEDSP